MTVREASGHVVSVASESVHASVWKLIAHVYTDEDRRIIVKWREYDESPPPPPGTPVRVTLTVDTEEAAE